MLIPLAWEGGGVGVALLGESPLTLAGAQRLGSLAGWVVRLHAQRAAGGAVPFERACAEALLACPHADDWPAILAAQLRQHGGARRAAVLRHEGERWRLIADSNAGAVARSSASARRSAQKFARLLSGDASQREPDARGIRLEHAADWGVLFEFDEGRAPGEAPLRRSLAGLLPLAERALPQCHRTGWRRTLARRLTRRTGADSPRGSRWVLALAALLLALALCVPVRETFDGDCELQPWQRFTVAAEVEGRVQSIAIGEGALVKQGQKLAELDTATLRTRLEVAREQHQEHDAQARKFQGAQDMTGYRLSKIKAGQAAQEETALLEDIRRSIFTAPIDGRVLTKGLAQKHGAVLRVGDTFCEVGGLDGWDLQIAIREDDLDAFTKALARRGRLPVNYRLKAGSAFALQAVVDSPKQVGEMAYPVDGRNVIYVTVPASALPEEFARDLRPGFSGRAKIEGAAKPWGVLLARRFQEYLRLHWWL